MNIADLLPWPIFNRNARFFGDGTRWRITKSKAGDWCIYPPLAMWTERSRPWRHGDFPDARFPTFEQARTFFAAGDTE